MVVHIYLVYSKLKWELVSQRDIGLLFTLSVLLKPNINVKLKFAANIMTLKLVKSNSQF